MQINEVSQLSPSQYAQFLPKQRFNIPKSTIQKVKSTITSLNSGIVSKENFKQSQSTPFSWVIGANNMSVIDLSQCYFNIAGTLEFPYGLNTTNKRVILGNLFTSSLFQNATLSLGGSVIAMNSNPGIDANMQAMLKYDFNDLKNYCLTDREFMIHDVDKDVDVTQKTIAFAAGFFVTDGQANNGSTVVKIKTAAAHLEYAGKYIYYINGTPVAQWINNTGAFAITGLQVTFDDAGNGVGVAYGSVTTGNIPSGSGNQAEKNLTNVQIWGIEDIITNYDRCSVLPNTTKAVEDATLTGYSLIPFRCKLFLSDLFNYTVDSLDYVFNREIKITLTRAATSYIISNLQALGAGAASGVSEVASMSKFELICYSYLLTDTARQQMIQYYSQPIETLYGIQTTNLTPLYNTEQNSEQTITLPLTVNYDTKAIILAFPKCSNALVPLSTNPTQATGGQITADNVGANTKTVYQQSWTYSNANSYNYGGLKYIRISNTNNSSIYTYDFQGTELTVNKPSAFLKAFDYTNAADDAASKILDYREAYNQYKELRLLFGKLPENGVDYYTYLKDYCIIPIDLAGTNIPPNTRIMITFQFAPFGDNYNPLYYGNVKKAGQQMTTNLLAIFLGSDVLAYNPDGTCTVKHVLSANPMEKNVNLV